MQSVKEVVTSLVDDDLVNTDKCGVQTVFWCLPSEASQKVFVVKVAFSVSNHTDRSMSCSSNLHSLPSSLRDLSQKKAKLKALQEGVGAREKIEQELQLKVEELGAGREATDEHAELLAAISGKNGRIADLDKELGRFAEFDPDHVEKINESMLPVRDAANRWTDNLFCCQSWIADKFGCERSEVCKQFDIPPDLDYLE